MKLKIDDFWGVKPTKNFAEYRLEPNFFHATIGFFMDLAGSVLVREGITEIDMYDMRSRGVIITHEMVTWKKEYHVELDNINMRLTVGFVYRDRASSRSAFFKMVEIAKKMEFEKTKKNLCSLIEEEFKKSEYYQETQLEYQEIDDDLLALI